MSNGSRFNTCFILSNNGIMHNEKTHTKEVKVRYSRDYCVFMGPNIVDT